MSGRLRIMVGLLTTLMLLGIASSLAVGERWGMAGGVALLGLYRGWVLIRQVRAGPSVIPPGPPTDPGRR